MEVPTGWESDGSALTRTFERDGFGGAIAFVNAVAAIAERLDHHPEIAVAWNRVNIRTWSHDTGGITARDLRLAAAIDAAAEA